MHDSDQRPLSCKLVHSYRSFCTALGRINARSFGEEDGDLHENPFEPYPDYETYGMANAIIHHGAHFCYEQFHLNEDTITQYILDDSAVQNTLTQLGKLFPEALEPDNFSDPTLNYTRMPKLSDYMDDLSQIDFFRKNIDLLWETKQKQQMLLNILPDISSCAIHNKQEEIKKIKTQATNVDFILGHISSSREFPSKTTSDSGLIKFNF